MISKIILVDEQCIYNNIDYWTAKAASDIQNFSEHVFTDVFGNKITTAELVSMEEFENSSRCNFVKQIKDLSYQVQYNIDVGKEFIALFREEFVRTPLKEMTSLDIAQKTANLIPLILTGSFREACDLLRLYEPDEFMTRERIDKYIAMLTSADAIDYNYEETNTEESTTVSETEEENVVENFTEELEEN